MCYKAFEALQWASSYLQSQQREAKAAEILLCYHLAMDKTKLLAHMQMLLRADQWQSFEYDVKQHAAGVPVQHLTGEEAFYGRLFQVTPEVLVPRPETEELVAAVLDRGKETVEKSKQVKILDVGTGSGVIAVTLALEIDDADVYAVDISSDALQVAEHNAYRHGVTVNFVQGDLCQPFLDRDARFDLVVSNPPYIPAAQYGALDELVRDHEPSVALCGGQDGLRVYQRLLDQVPDVLAECGMVAVEVGIHQAAVIERMFLSLPHICQTEVKQDINGKNRMVIARFRNKEV